MDLKTENIQILIVEDYELIAVAFKELLNKQSNISIVKEVKTREEALELLRKGSDIDLVLMDLFLGKEESHEEPEGLKACREIIEEINQKLLKKLKLILLTAHLEGKWIRRAFDIGVNGYVTKDQGIDVLLRAIDNISRNGQFYRYYEGKVEKAMLEHDARRKKVEDEPIRLTPAEKEILGLLSRGFTIREIAEYRGIVEGTVNIHRRNFFEKLGAANAPDAVRIAMELGLLP